MTTVIRHSLLHALHGNNSQYISTVHSVKQSSMLSDVCNVCTLGFTSKLHLAHCLLFQPCTYIFFSFMLEQLFSKTSSSYGWAKQLYLTANNKHACDCLKCIPKVYMIFHTSQLPQTKNTWWLHTLWVTWGLILLDVLQVMDVWGAIEKSYFLSNHHFDSFTSPLVDNFRQGRSKQLDE